MSLRKYTPISPRRALQDPLAKPMVVHLDLFHNDPIEHMHMHIAMMKPLAHDGMIVVTSAKSALSHLLHHMPIAHKDHSESLMITDVQLNLSEEICKILAEKNMKIQSQLDFADSHIDFADLRLEKIEASIPRLLENLVNDAHRYSAYEKIILIEDNEEQDRREQYKLRNKHYRGKMNRPKK